MTYLENDAVISDCKQYRYLLRRTWNFERPRCLFVMLNPSTADATIDDPTIRSCVQIANGAGYGSFEVVNLFAWRATEPDALLLPAVVPIAVGPNNDGTIRSAINRCDMVICAWGDHKAAAKRSRSVVEIIRSERPAAFCLGKTKAREPKHPLYIKTGTPLEAYP